MRSTNPAADTTESPSRVLFVPDNLLSGELRESFLDRNSVLARTASSADIAISMAELWHPSLIVFRSDLEGVRISDFCAKLRSTEANRAMKLVMLTEQLGTLDDAFDANCDCHLISPVDNAQLIDSIATLLHVAQRRTPRAMLETLVHTRGFADIEGAVDPTLGNSINVSEDGMLLECNRQLQLRTEGLLQFFLPNAGTRLTLKGTVQLAVDEVRLHYAIEFNDVDAHDRGLLRSYVQECNAA